MRRSRAWRRYKTRCHIAKRLRIISSAWRWRTSLGTQDHLWFTETNRLNKYNLRCTCRMCSYCKDRYNRAKEKSEDIKRALVPQLEEGSRSERE